MALTKNQKSLCNKLVSDFDGLIQPAKSAKGAIKGATNAMKGALSGMTYSDPGLLDDALDDYKDQVQDVLPGDQAEDIEEIKDFIDNCEYLQFLDPVSAIMGTVGGIYDELNNLIDSFDLTFPEFNVGGLASLVDKLLSGVNIPGGDIISDLLKAADNLLTCLANGCAAFDPSYVTPLSQKAVELQQVYDDLGLVDDPLDPDYAKFDYTAMYNELGMTTAEKEAIDKVKGVINLSKDDGADAVKKTTDAIKLAKKIGSFF